MKRILVLDCKLSGSNLKTVKKLWFPYKTYLIKQMTKILYKVKKQRGTTMKNEMLSQSVADIRRVNGKRYEMLFRKR